MWSHKIRRCKLVEMKKFEWGNSYHVSDENKISHEVNDDLFALTINDINIKFKLYLEKKIKENKKTVAANHGCRFESCPLRHLLTLYFESL